jgi:hypothetical protein
MIVRPDIVDELEIKDIANRRAPAPSAHAIAHSRIDHAHAIASNVHTIAHTRNAQACNASLVFYLINYRLTFLLFQESVSTGLMMRIVLNDGIERN